MFEIKRETKQGDPLSSLLCNTVLPAALKDDLLRWREKGLGIRLGDSQADCLSTPRFADDVPLFPTSPEKLRSMICDFKKSTESVELKILPDKTKIKIFQQSGIEQKQRGVDRQHQSRGITSERMCQVSRRNNNVRATRNNRNQESTPSSLGIIYQVLTGANIEIVISTKQTSLTQYGRHSYADIRLWNMDTLART